MGIGKSELLYLPVSLMLTIASWAGDRQMFETATNPMKSGPVAINMTSRIISSPVSSDQGPKFVPDAIVEYQVTASFPDGGANFNSFTETVPPFMALFIGDMGGGYGPIMWQSSDPGIRIDYKNLDSLDDDIEFSADGGQNYDYVPTPGPKGFNRKVTNFRIKPTFTPRHSGSAKVIIKYRMRVR